MLDFSLTNGAALGGGGGGFEQPQYLGEGSNHQCI